MRSGYEYLSTTWAAAATPTRFGYILIQQTRTELDHHLDHYGYDDYDDYDEYDEDDEYDEYDEDDGFY